MHWSIAYEEASLSFKVNKWPKSDPFLYIQKPPNSKAVPSRKLTYPTWGKGKSSSKVTW